MGTELPARPVAAASLLAGVAVLAVLIGCGKRNEYLQSTGTVSAFKTVDLMARVEGYLRSVDFRDGSLVKAGQLLFVIEPEPYQAKLASQQAALLNAQT